MTKTTVFEQNKTAKYLGERQVTYLLPWKTEWCWPNISSCLAINSILAPITMYLSIDRWQTKMPPCAHSKQEETCIQNLYPQQAVAQGTLSSRNGKLATPAQGDLEQDKMVFFFWSIFLNVWKNYGENKGLHVKVRDGKKPVRWVEYTIRKMSLKSKVSRAEDSVIQFPDLLWNPKWPCHKSKCTQKPLAQRTAKAVLYYKVF